MDMTWTRHLRVSISRETIALVYRLMMEHGKQEWPFFLLSFILLSIVRKGKPNGRSF